MSMVENARVPTFCRGLCKHSITAPYCYDADDNVDVEADMTFGSSD
jgi:hypothetical protein